MLWTSSFKTFNFAQFFKIPYDDWVTIVYKMGKELHQSYNEVCDMPFFLILMILEKFAEEVKEENKRTTKQNDQIEKQMASSQNQMNSIQNTFNQNMKIPEMSMPNITMPNIEMPK